MADKKKENVMAKVIARAWKDPAFKKRLQANPESVLKEMGIDLPKGVKIHLIEDNSTTFTFVLPLPPVSFGHLSDAELEKIAGAGGDCIWSNL